MPKLTDNELDNLFRDAAGRTNPEFDPQDWDDMAKRLEHEERAARARSTTLYSMVALLLIYSFLPQFGTTPLIQTASWFQSETAQDLTAVKDAENKDDVGPQTTSAHATGEGDVKDQSTETLTGIDPGSVDNTTSRREPKLDKTAGQDKTTGPTAETKKKVREGQPASRRRSSSVEDSNEWHATKALQFSGDQAIGGSSVHNSNTFNSESEVSINATPSDQRGVESTFTKGEYYPSGFLMSDDSITIDADEIIQPVTLDAIHYNAETIIKPEQPTLSHKWFVKLAVSPDFSSIDYSKPGDPGINLGVLGEYQLSDHFSISTGAIWSKKLYDLDNPDKSYGSGGYVSKAKTLNGDCRVLDLPLNVTYYVFPQRRTNLFVTLGTSSYIMLKEQYIYTVWANHKEYQYEENYEHKNNEWFSMLNVSIGIQYHLSKHFLIQGEPFLRAPISGVGEGKVNLMSTGVFFSLKYQISHY